MEARRASSRQRCRHAAGHARVHAAHALLDFICPITTEVMSDPVMAADGHAYERTAIERWLATKSTSPMTGEELGNTGLFPNHILRRMIREWQGAQ